MVTKGGVNVVVLMSWKFMFREFRSYFAGKWSLVKAYLCGGCWREKIFKVGCAPFGNPIRCVVAGEVCMSFDPSEKDGDVF